MEKAYLKDLKKAPDYRIIELGTSGEIYHFCPVLGELRKYKHYPERVLAYGKEWELIKEKIPDTRNEYFYYYI